MDEKTLELEPELKVTELLELNRGIFFYVLDTKDIKETCNLLDAILKTYI